MGGDRQVMPEDTQRVVGQSAQRNNILAAKIVADAVKTTLGPKGMDKMLVDSLGDVIVTNDGATILQEMAVEHPAAKMLVEIAKTQEQEVGDGTTSAVILAGALLAQAEKLLDKNIHPTTIIAGYTLALQKSLELLEKSSIALDTKSDDHLLAIASTAMTGKSAEMAKDTLPQLCVDAVKQVAKNNVVELHSIRLQKVMHQGEKSSALLRGIVLDKERVHSAMPSSVKQAKVALLNMPIENRETETSANITINNPEQMQQYLDQEEKLVKALVDKVIASGANVVFNQKGVDEVAQHYFAKAGILVARRVRRTDLESLSNALSCPIINNVQGLDEKALGTADSVTQETIGTSSMLVVSSAENTSVVSLLLHGQTPHVVDELLRCVQDALGDLAAAVRSGKVVAGAGAIEMQLHRGLEEYARTLKGREQLAVLAFAESLLDIPTTLAQNGGLDPIDTLAALQAAHENGKTRSGINVLAGGVFDAESQEILEPLLVKKQALQSASHVAMMILRIDDIIASAPMQEPLQ